jgi:hypothetical protein
MLTSLGGLMPGWPIESLDPPINGAIITGTVALAGIFWTHRLARRRERKTSSQKFRQNILDLFQGLYPIASNWPKDPMDIDPILRAIFPKLQVAVAEFRRVVPFYYRRAFDRAWFRYRNAHEREIDDQCYHHYIFSQLAGNPKDYFKKNVDKLLSFAK